MVTSPCFEIVLLDLGLVFTPHAQVYNFDRSISDFLKCFMKHLKDPGHFIEDYIKRPGEYRSDK
jgi:hypothetical protein